MESLTREKMKELYLPPSDRFVMVDIPELLFFMIDGEGDPDGEAYVHAVRWLFAAAYPIKRIARNRMGRNFVEPPLEALWWSDDPADFVARRKDTLKWRLMIPGPEWAAEEMWSDAVAVASKRLGEIPASLRLEAFREGDCVQIMHLGSPQNIPATYVRLHEEYLPSRGLVPCGPHHEIYLKDPNRTAPDKMKIVLRLPVRARLSSAVADGTEHGA